MITYKGNTIGILNDLTETQTLSTHGKFLEDNITISPDLEEYDGSVSSMVTYKTFTVRIDTTNSNSLTCVTYEDDAVGMTKGSSAWDSEVIFKDIKPCVFANGQVVYYLNPANFN